MMDTEWTFDFAYDASRNIVRIEVFDNERCVISRIAHTTDELTRIGTDLAPLEIPTLAEKIEKAVKDWEYIISLRN